MTMDLRPDAGWETAACLRAPSVPLLATTLHLLSVWRGRPSATWACPRRAAGGETTACLRERSVLLLLALLAAPKTALSPLWLSVLTLTSREHLSVYQFSWIINSFSISVKNSIADLSLKQFVTVGSWNAIILV